MMKNKLLITLLISLFCINVFAQWQPAGDKIKTAWAEKIDINNVFDWKILVPFAVESSLSGVQKSVVDENEMWYRPYDNFQNYKL